MGCEGCRERNAAPPIRVEVRRDGPRATTWYLVGLALGWFARGVFADV